MKAIMRYLGVMRGNGSLSCDGQPLGKVEYEIEGYLNRAGEVVGSAEIRMASAELDYAYGRRNLQLTAEDGRVLDVRFSSNRNDARNSEAHADIRGDLPPASQWRR